MSRLRLQRITRRFGGLVALDGVSFEVAERGVTAIIGPNGAGKTTLFNVVSGFLAPSEGKVIFDGADITGFPPQSIAARGLIRTFQLVKLFEDLSVLDNVKAGCHLHSAGGLLAALLRPDWARREEREVEEKARQLLDFVGLPQEADIPASSLSYGHQRLLELARALAAGPRLLLLDEPAAGLNADESANLSRTIRRIAGDGTTVLLIEHDMIVVMNTADWVVVVDFGRKIAEGTPSEVRENPAVIEAYLGGTKVLRAEPGRD
jgi:branched-chain amino acid transport system ATP-binding protein